MDFLLNLIFPARCLVCNTYLPSREALCEQCTGGIELRKNFMCGTCFARLPRPYSETPHPTSAAIFSATNHSSLLEIDTAIPRRASRLSLEKSRRVVTDENSRIRSVKKICHKETPYVLGAAADYEDEAVRTLVGSLKFKGVKLAASPLSEILIRYAKIVPMPQENIAVIPVPLGIERLRVRGFNQSELIAVHFAAYFNLPLFSRALVRIKNTPPQSDLPFRERAANVARAFKADASLLRGYRTVILIDDVTTSGATFREASRALKTAGVRTVYALAVAKAG